MAKDPGVMNLLHGLLGQGTETSPEELMAELGGFLMEGEPIHVGYRLIRDSIAFTDRRVLIVDRQGITGRKAQYVSVPYRAITRFAVETAGTLDIDTDILIWTMGGDDPIRMACRRDNDMRGIQAALSWGVFSS